jgi:hypothetical protein
VVVGLVALLGDDNDSSSPSITSVVNSREFPTQSSSNPLSSLSLVPSLLLLSSSLSEPSLTLMLDESSLAVPAPTGAPTTAGAGCGAVGGVRAAVCDPLEATAFPPATVLSSGTRARLAPAGANASPAGSFLEAVGDDGGSLQSFAPSGGSCTFRVDWDDDAVVVVFVVDGEETIPVVGSFAAAAGAIPESSDAPRPEPRGGGDDCDGATEQEEEGKEEKSEAVAAGGGGTCRNVGSLCRPCC